MGNNTAHLRLFIFVIYKMVIMAPIYQNLKADLKIEWAKIGL